MYFCETDTSPTFDFQIALYIGTINIINDHMELIDNKNHI